MNGAATTQIHLAVGEPSMLTAEQPWPGASPYREVDRAWFFGRKLETEEILRLLRRDTLTLLSGPAGVGKTSLVQAGIIPALREDDALPVIVRLDWGQSVPPATQADNDSAEPPPGALANPLTRQLLTALAAAAQAAGLASPVVQQDDTLWEFFHRQGHRWWSARQRVVTPVFILDQFEEAFLAGYENATARRHTEGLFEQLSQLAANRPPTRVGARLESGMESDEAFDFDAVPVRVLLVLREEYSAQLTSLRAHFPALRRSEYRLAAFSRSQARDVLLRASAQRNLFAEGAIDELVAALAGSGGVLPAQLSLTAGRLAAERLEQGWPVITSAHFRATPRPPSAVRSPSAVRPPSAVQAPSSVIAPPPGNLVPSPDDVALERRARRNGVLAGLFGFVALVLLGAVGFAARELMRTQAALVRAQEAAAAVQGAPGTVVEVVETPRPTAASPPPVESVAAKIPDPTPEPKPPPTPEPAVSTIVPPRPKAPEPLPPPPVNAPQSNLESPHIDVGLATPKPPAADVSRVREQQERDEFLRRQEARERAQREVREAAQREAAAQRERERKAAAARTQPPSELKPFNAAPPRVATPAPKPAPKPPPPVIR
jgi:hypothetical protein